jgi:hypothetical protein
MATYDLCVAWNWEYDADFMALLDGACRARGLTLLQVTPDSLEAALRSITEQQASLRVFWDRASEVDARFSRLVHYAIEKAVTWINPYAQAAATWDKAVMHLAFVGAGLEVPRTIILPAYGEQPALPPVGLPALDGQFTLKPAHGSGGEGVVTQVTSWEQVLAVRQQHAADRYLLQAHVVPKEMGGRPAWFRVIDCAGRVYPCWWNPETHVYTPVTWQEQLDLGLGHLHDMAQSIAGLCGLDLFSTEIALNRDDVLVIVDYVNDQIDLRLQSKTGDGVPDDIVHDIAERLVSQVETHCAPLAVERSIRP